MILIDTSAWIEYLRGSGSAACEAVDALIAQKFAVSDVVVMEVLAGARNEHHLLQLRGLLARGTLVTTESVDYETAASFYRRCRLNGETVRTLVDCLIAAVASRQGLSVLHQDNDFNVLARHTKLRIEN